MGGLFAYMWYSEEGLSGAAAQFLPRPLIAVPNVIVG